MIEQGDHAGVADAFRFGAQVDAKIGVGSPPLHHAACLGRAEAVTVLFRAVADPRATDGEGKTPHALTEDEECRDLPRSAMTEKPLE